MRFEDLTIITGGPRARVLRSLGEPRAMGDLAAELGVAPSSATHHVRALEAAGLVARRRDGSTILVSRTARGAALIMLCDAAPRGGLSYAS
jgi:DNA-binding MarR family transcriptional regulator